MTTMNKITQYLKEIVPVDIADECLSTYELNQFLKDIIPDKNERDYLLSFLTSCLNGERNKIIFYGTGSNGKTTLINLIQQTFGDNFSRFPNQIMNRSESDRKITSDRELYAIHNKKIVYCEDNNLNSYALQDDIFKYRKIYTQEYIDFKCTFNMIISCNHIPDNIDTNVIHFNTKFVDNPTKPNEKLRDVNIYDKIKNWKHEFTILLLTHEKTE